MGNFWKFTVYTSLLNVLVMLTATQFANCNRLTMKEKIA